MTNIESILNKHADKLVDDPKKNGIPVELQTQNRKPSEAVTTLKINVPPRKPFDVPKGASPEEAAAILAKREETRKAKAVARISNMKAKQNGDTRKMPLEGKAAAEAIKRADKALKEEERLAAIAKSAVDAGHPVTRVPAGQRALPPAPASSPSDRSPGMKRLRESGKGEQIAAKHVAESKEATKAKPAKSEKPKTPKKAAAKTKSAPKTAPKKAAKNGNGERKPTWFKEEHGTRAVQMLKRKNGATSSELQKELRWPAITCRRFVRDIVRGKLHLRVESDRSGGDTRWTVIA